MGPGSLPVDLWSVPHILVPYLLVRFGLTRLQTVGLVVGWELVELFVRSIDPARASWIVVYTPWVHEYESWVNVAMDVVLGLAGVVLAVVDRVEGKGVLGHKVAQRSIMVRR